jgi:hypothetical protein
MIVQIIISIVGIYLLFGFLFAIPFVIRGVVDIDKGTHGTKLGFRLIIIPGTIVFWPLLLSKWIKSNKKND